MLWIGMLTENQGNRVSLPAGVWEQMSYKCTALVLKCCPVERRSEDFRSALGHLSGHLSGHSSPEIGIKILSLPRTLISYTFNAPSRKQGESCPMAAGLWVYGS